MTLKHVDVAWARAFKGFLREPLRIHSQAYRRGDRSEARGLRLEGASQAQQAWARIVLAVMESAQETTALGVCMAGLCGLYRHDCA
jgi:hypothetical protein